MSRRDIIINPFVRNADVISGMTLANRDFLSFAKFDNEAAWMMARKKVEMQLLEDMGLNDFMSIIPKQVHGSDIICVDKKVMVSMQQKNLPLLFEADGLYSYDAGILLCVCVADCAGVVIHDAKSGFKAVLHSGWRGTVGACISGTPKNGQKNGQKNEQKNARSIVKTCMEDVVVPQGIALQDLCVWISPSAKSCCYEVGNEIIHLFTDYPQSIIEKDNALYVDISMYIHEELVALGIHPNQIIRDSTCTICSKHLHSHRRDGKKAGRAITFVGSV